MKLNDNVAVVTGGASGLGAAVSRLLTAKGSKVAILDRHLAAAKDLANELKGIAIGCDVSDASSVEAAFQTLKETSHVPRICVNCAGILSAERVLGKTGVMSLDSFRSVIDVNLIGTFNVLRVAVNEMQHLPLEDEERGIIINTASIAAFEGQIGQASYSASKAGVVGLTLPIARELAAFQIRVVTIAPGIFETPMMAKLNDKAKENLIAGTVFPKRLGQPEQFAQLVVHVIENSMLNGTTIRLDGGVRLTAK